MMTRIKSDVDFLGSGIDSQRYSTHFQLSNANAVRPLHRLRCWYHLKLKCKHSYSSLGR